MRKISNRCDSGRDLSACVDTRKKIVAIQIALFSACGDTRKNSRDLNRDSNRAFLVCGNGPNSAVYTCIETLECFFSHSGFWLPVTRPGGGGTRLSCGRGGGGGAAGGRKPDLSVAMRSVHKKYTLSQYTLLQICICIPCRNIAPSLVPRSRACDKHCGLGTPGKQPCDKRRSPPVAN